MEPEPTTRSSTRTALSVAGVDPSGGAGLAADLAVFNRFGLHGTAVVTLLTAQNTRRVSAVRPVDAGFVLDQLEAVLGDVPPAAAKTGALGTAELIRAVAERAERFSFPLVVDPVMVSKHGDPLIDGDAVAALREHLLPRATLLTPNRHEAARLLGREVGTVDQAEDAARALVDLGAGAALVKGGEHGGRSVDVLCSGGEVRRLDAGWIDTDRTHGSGCVLSAAVTAGLAGGRPLGEAVDAAKRFVTEAIRTAPGLGGGRGPLNLLAQPATHRTHGR